MKDEMDELTKRLLDTFLSVFCEKLGIESDFITQKNNSPSVSLPKYAFIYLATRYGFTQKELEEYLDYSNRGISKQVELHHDYLKNSVRYQMIWQQVCDLERELVAS
jgi:hypothetical protein